MYIVMHCGGMPFNGETIAHSSLGGSESAAYYLAKELAAQGHRVTLFTNHPDEGSWDGVQYRYVGDLTEQTPLGARYHTYAVATPHDLNITQRQPDAFRFPVSAKVSALWVHDVPNTDHAPNARASMLNSDLIFTVSEWQREKVIEAWGINPENVVTIGNGVDLDLFCTGDRIDSKVAQAIAADGHAFRMIYSSRPERGLETLVKPGGIMEQIADADAHLYICNYANVTAQMRPYYDWLYSRCEELPNVTVLGNLNKQELAETMRQCDLLAYPTIFEETSCITAMEAMAAGLPMLSSYLGALPETCDGSGTVLLPLDEAAIRPGMMQVGDHSKAVNEALFVEVLRDLMGDHDTRAPMAELQQAAAKLHSWNLAADKAIAAVEAVFEEVSIAAKARHLMRMSDIYALRGMIDGLENFKASDRITGSTLRELDECYAFTEAPVWDEHYKNYYEYEKNRGVDYGPETLDGNNRFEYVSSLVGRLPMGSRVLDYGCAHGHYTINLAKRFPGTHFIGVDITPSNVEKARTWAESDGLENVEFRVGRVEDGAILDQNGRCPSLGVDLFDAVIAAEVLEHVADPQNHIDVLGQYLLAADHARMIVTVPYGPWEAMGYEEHWPWRAHVHHFERADLEDMCGSFPHYQATVVSSGRTPAMEPIGSYVISFGRPSSGAGAVNYARKLSELAPRQTLSVCMIVKDAEGSIRNAIESVAAVADEFVIALDKGTTDDTEAALRRALGAFCPHTPAHIFEADSPTEIGFDAARNATIEQASGDWILWMDADEVIDGAANLLPRLRHNAFDAYSLPHHHFSLDPAGLLKTDYPARVFRNRKGIRFFGVVHEHPETGLNQSIPNAIALPDVVVAHYGYKNEDIRRGRFDRNLPLLMRDREQYPDRYLGKFLWIRDLFQSTQYDMERGSLVTSEHIARAEEAAELWEDLLVSDAPVRLVTESLEWYGTLQRILGRGIPYTFAVKGPAGEHLAEGWFKDRTHANMLAARLMREVEE